MPTFKITGPDGKSYNVTGDNAEGALEALKSHLGEGQAEQPSMVGGALKALGSGIRRGAEMAVGGLGDVAGLNSRVAQWGSEKLGASPETSATVGNIARMVSPGFGLSPTTKQTETLTNNLVGEKHQPQNMLESGLDTAGSFLPAAIGGEGSLAKRLIVQSIIPALGSEGAGQAAKKYAPQLEPYARAAGALLSPLGAKAVSPAAGVSDARQAAAAALQKEGVDLTAGQATGSKSLRYAESELGGGSAAEKMDQQGSQFTKAALSKAGVNADRATPEAIDKGFTDVGKKFDDLAANNKLDADQQLISDLKDVYTDYGQMVPQSSRAPIVDGITNDIVTAVSQNGGLDGKSYQSLTSRLARAARGTQDPELKQALNGIRNTLDDAMERSIQANNPNDAGAWKEARNQYRNLLVIEQAATGAGEQAAQGIITPARLRAATISKQGRRNYARGNTDFDELARSGEATMTPLPNSGTAARMAVRGMPGVGTVLGSVVGQHLGGAPGAAIGAGAGATLPWMVGQALMSPAVQAYLKNQLMNGTNPQSAAVVNALISGQRALPPPQ